MPRQPRKSANPLDIPDARFEGTRYSNQELRFLLAHLGEPAIVAMPPEDDLPEGVNEAAVEPILDRTHQLALYEQSLQERSKDDTIRVWCGFAALREVCQQTLDARAEIQVYKRRVAGRRGAVRLAASVPSLHMWDSTGAMLGAVGADHDMVLTRVLPGGERQALYVEIQQSGKGDVQSLAGVADMINKTAVRTHLANELLAETPMELVFDEGESFGTVTCPICERSETFETAKPSSKLSATRKMHKHLKEESVIKVDQHRLLASRLNTGRAGNKIKPIAVGV